LAFRRPFGSKIRRIRHVLCEKRQHPVGQVLGGLGGPCPTGGFAEARPPATRLITRVVSSDVTKVRYFPEEPIFSATIAPAARLSSPDFHGAINSGLTGTARRAPLR